MSMNLKGMEYVAELWPLKISNSVEKVLQKITESFVEESENCYLYMIYAHCQAVKIVLV